MNLDKFQDLESLSGEGNAEDLLKAMEAGLGTGRDYTDTAHNGQGLKVESLDPVVKILTNQMVQAWTWNNIPKERIFNTVREYNELNKYGDQIGIFNLEGETPQSTDTQYTRRAVITKYTGVSGQISHPAMLVRNAGGIDPVATEVKNKTELLLQEIDRLMTIADSSKIPAQFDGTFRQHFVGINNITGGITGKTSEAALDDYFGDIAVIDADGHILTDALVGDATQAVVEERAGMMVSHILTSPTVKNNYVQQFLGVKSVFVNNPIAGTTGATMGQNVSSIATSFGNVDIATDVFFDRLSPKKYNASNTSDKAPATPTIGGTPLAVNNDTKTKFTNHAGDYYYIVTAKNRYGESAPLVMNTSAQAVTAAQSVDISFTATAGTYAPESFVIYRTVADVANRTTANYYPIIEVSATELAAGYDGGAADLVRDRNRKIAGTQSAFVFYNSAEQWQYLQLAPTMRMDYAITAPSRRFSVLNYGTPALYMPGKWARIINIGTATS